MECPSLAIPVYHTLGYSLVHNAIKIGRFYLFNMSSPGLTAVRFSGGLPEKDLFHLYLCIACHGAIEVMTLLQVPLQEW